MKLIIKFILLIFSLNCFSQQDTAVLIIPIKYSNIEFDKKVLKMLQYNNVKIDSAKRFIIDLSYNAFKKYFPNYTFQKINDLNQNILKADSLLFFDQWSSSQFEKIKNSQGIKKIIYNNDDKERSQYFGCILSDKDSSDLRKLIQIYNFKYVFLFNKFETITKKPFSQKTILRLHFEILDNNLKKVFGDKNNWTGDISTTMYYNVFKYYTQNTIDDFLKLLKKQ